MMKVFLFLIVVFSLNAAFSEDKPQIPIESLQNQYADAVITWREQPKLAETDRVDTPYEVRPGVVRVTIHDKDGAIRMEEWGFRAMKMAWIAKRRIRPGEDLARDDFQTEEIDLTEPLIHEVRGLILSANAELEKLEARVTILEGQFPITSGVQKIPAVKRGEIVRLVLRTGDLVLSVPGVVQEPSQIGGTLKVLTSATKREVTGVLQEGKIVEVSL